LTRFEVVYGSVVRRRDVSWTKLRAGLVLSAVAVLFLGAACKRNHPPTIPEVSGRLTYHPGDTARLSATATDQDGDSLSYLFAWVDSASAVWTDNYPNGATATASHAYARSDTYMVRVRARDSRDAESGWSPAQALAVGVFAPGVPARPAGPDSGVTGDTYRCSTHAASPYGEPLRIEYDWGGAKGDTYPPVPNDSPCIGAHVYLLAGTYHVRARAGDTAGLYSAWSDSLAVAVVCRDTTPPAVAIISPADGDTARRGLIVINAVAADDQIVTRVEFSFDGSLTGTDSAAEGDTYSYAWTDTVAQVPYESHTIVATAFDAGGNQASDTVSITVINGWVRWYWQDPVEQTGMVTSPVVASDGVDEVVMSDCYGDWTFYSIKAYNGHSKSRATTRWQEYDFSGHPALCALTGHVIAGSDEGELYALSLQDLSRAWRWPDMAAETLEPFAEFGAPAINGNVIYVGREEDYDALFRLYKFTDNGGSVIRSAAYDMAGQSVVDAPAIGSDGSVYFGTDSGYLVKIDADLTAPIWRKHLMRVGEVSGPIIGSDGTVYCCCTDSLRLYAVSGDGSVLWSVALDGIGKRPALGRSALFVGTDMGTVYSINPQSGAINWQKSFNAGQSFYTTPIVAANGYLYIQSDLDILYCLAQSDGTFIWSCDCNFYLPGGGKGGNPHRQRKLSLVYYDPNPSITAEGDIIVVGQFALFCVAGDSSQLDTSAPWPKWQKDLFNTGRK
jgi:outer membrane protein assembly factor BamB